MSDAVVYVTQLPNGVAIDNVTVVTGSGTVYRQRTTERDLITEIDASRSVSTSAVTAIAAGLPQNWVNIQNVSTNGNLLGYTYDGSTPVISAGIPGAGTFILLPFGSISWSTRIPTAALQIIGSAAGTIATIKYA